MKRASARPPHRHDQLTCHRSDSLYPLLYFLFIRLLFICARTRYFTHNLSRMMSADQNRTHVVFVWINTLNRVDRKMLVRCFSFSQPHCTRSTFISLRSMFTWKYNLILYDFFFLLSFDREKNKCYSTNTSFHSFISTIFERCAFTRRPDVYILFRIYRLLL